MTLPRKSQISLVDTKYYHCMSRCVRRAFLCGEDAYSGKSYEHRRQWIENKIFLLAEVFCIDICAYAVMSNHLHLVLHVDDDKAKQLSDKEVLTRWHKLFKGTFLTQQHLAGEQLDEAQKQTLRATVAVYRERLFSISWFMRMLSENIARRANKEDDCTGRFWEGRFKSQALLDEAALAACMAYVDLNPVRAKMANTLEKSDYTSIQKRIDCAKEGKQPDALLPFQSNVNNANKKENNANSAKANMANCLPFQLEYYVQLVELTGRCIRKDKRGHIDTQPILARINIEPTNWLTMTTQFTTLFHGAVGREKMIQSYNEHLHRQRRVNISHCKRYLA